MPRLRLGRSYWLDAFGGRAPRYPALGADRQRRRRHRRRRHDRLRRRPAVRPRGRAVVLVEAERIGRGSTAASTALLMQEPDTDFIALSDRYGAARAAANLAVQPGGRPDDAAHACGARHSVASRAAVGVFHPRRRRRGGAAARGRGAPARRARRRGGSTPQRSATLPASTRRARS